MLKSVSIDTRLKAMRRLPGDEIVGANLGLKHVMHKVQQVASLDSPVLLLGETGTGKDVIANSIHYSSSRSAGPFAGERRDRRS
jgi:transcriptional regulator with PAS, ATPase and Fis domain